MSVTTAVVEEGEPLLVCRVVAKQLLDGVHSPRRSFWRRVAWSPDGTHLLAQSDEHQLDLFCSEVTSNVYTLKLLYSTRAPTTLLDFAWFPFARYDDARTWCFVLSARDVPVRLVDAYAGQTRATYGLQDHTERFVGPQALCFSLDGTRLYCGHEATLTTCDISKPGVNTYINSLRLSPSKRAVRQGKAASGQRGCISAIAVGIDRAGGTEQEVIAVGTFAGDVAIYKTQLATSEGEEACLFGWKEDLSQGISQLSFHPFDPYLLFVASRRSDAIRLYDLRYIGQRRSFLHNAPPVSLVASCITSHAQAKKCTSQQRIFFDIDRDGRNLVAGDISGYVSIWHIDSPPVVDEGDAKKDRSCAFSAGLQQKLPRVRHWQAARDAIPSVAMHPFLPICAVSSGSRNWDIDEEESYRVEDGAISLYTL